MIRKLLSLLAIFPSLLSAQWRPLDVPTVGRYDDVFFIDNLHGWAANSQGNIFKTEDGGVTWAFNFKADNYLRSIEFATPSLGYAGSLNNSIYRTQDGGDNWVNITDNIDFDITYNEVNYTSIPGACGLSAPSENTIYACGLWSGDPPFLSKSLDGGDTWTSYDMSAHATQLVDVLFLNDNEGFLTGRNDPVDGEKKGGVILYTEDGGETWTTVVETMTQGDYIWKIQTPDSVNFFGSIQSLPSTENVRIVKSTNIGQTWEIKTVQANKWNYMQMVGFKDENTGWTGGSWSTNQGRETALFETKDGGDTWSKIPTLGNSTFNRFFMVDSETIYMTGAQVYIYDENYPDDNETETPLSTEKLFHSLTVSPNPANNVLEVGLTISQFTRSKLELYNSLGQLVRVIQEGTLHPADHSFVVPVVDLKSGIYFVVLHTNEGLNYSRILKE